MSTDRMKNKKTEIPTEIWLDYVEDEVEKSFREDLDRVLAHHAHHQKTVKELIHLKKNIKDTPMSLPGDEVFNKLKNQIMAKVEKTTPLPKVSPWRAHNRAMAMATAAMCVLVVGALLTQVDLDILKSKDRNSKPSLEEQLISENIKQNSELYNNLVMDQQNGEDFIQDAMVEKLSRLPEKQALKMIEKLK